MAHLWIKTADGWGAQNLDAAKFVLSASGVAQAAHVPTGSAGDKAARLIQANSSGSHVWSLVTPRDSNMRVNGCEVLAGLRVLADRDEIRTDDGIQCFFSTETLAVIEAFPGADREVFCGRCRQPIKTGASAVRCPGCQIWYHQDDSESLPCWTYTDKCNFCPNPTALDSGFMWIPED